MKKTVLTYGIISGLIVSAWVLVVAFTGCSDMDSRWGMVLGYTTQIVAFSFIFVAVKKYREQSGNGQVTFGKAFKIGLYISLIASTFYVVGWLIAYYFFVPDFIEKYAAHTIEQLKNSGATMAKIKAKTQEMADFAKMYKNPLFNAAFTYMEVLPLGLLASLLAAAILKRKPESF